MDKLKRGTQIAYVPTHTKGDINHNDVERGFVTSGPTKDGAYFCRYWSRYHEKELRTKANSECTPADCLQVTDSFPQELIEEMLEKYC